MTTAWDLIGFGGDVDGQPASVRTVGGRTLYEAVDYNVTGDRWGGRMVRLARLEVTDDGIRQITRYVEPDTPLEVVLDEAKQNR